MNRKLKCILATEQSIRFAALGSGSKGNALAVQQGAQCILVDAGFSRRELFKRLETVGIERTHILGVLLTHEHEDHVKGARVLCDDLDIALYATHRTIDFLRKKSQLPAKVFAFEPGDRFDLGAFHVEAFSLQHDAIDPVGYLIESCCCRIGVATDLGEVNHLVRTRLTGCDALVLESNYDRDMLMNSARPLHLKRRIMGRHGHLDNADAAEALGALLTARTRLLWLAHLSAECNDRTLAESLFSERLKALERQDLMFSLLEQNQVLCCDFTAGGVL